MKMLKKSIIQDALSLLPRETPIKLVIFVILQICISTLDILAIVLLGIISKMSFDYIQNEVITFPDLITKVLAIEKLNFESQALIISILIVVLFSSRTTLSIYLSRRILLFLASQASYASNRILEKMLRSKPDVVTARNSQEVLYGITSGIDNLTLVFLGSITIFVSELCFLVALLSVVIIVQPVTGIIALFIFVLSTLGINKLTSARARQDSSEYANLSILYSRRLLDTLLVYRELFLRKKELQVTGEVQTARTNSLLLRAQLMFLPSLSKYLFEITLILGCAIMAIIQVILSDAMTAVSAVTVFLSAASRILPSLIRAQGAYLSIRQSEGSSEVTIQQLRDLERQDKIIASGPKYFDENHIFTPSIKVTNLSFSYDLNSDFALKNISFEVKPGQFVAIVGESGSGKSTLIDLMLGMLTPNSGSVEISQTPPLDAIYRWPGKIAFVPQDIAIVDGSVRKNITLEDSPESSDSEILKALEEAHLKNDVLKMPSGLHEIVGERGTRLSGGQRQRLGIARALYTKPQIIIFDEATSSLDPLTEKTVTKAIYDKNGDKTLIVIAHRLSTIKNADLVILIEKGELIAKGSFEDIRTISPKFDEQAKLVNL